MNETSVDGADPTSTNDAVVSAITHKQVSTKTQDMKRR